MGNTGLGPARSSTGYTYPFGQHVFRVEQGDRSPKKAFVLGVYSSAVHARWVAKDGRTMVSALAVASEPDIFWKGEGVEEILKNINIPEALGKLVPAAKDMNGSSGRALDEHYLSHLGLDRQDVWLCDLVTHSLLNPGQKKAIEDKYEPLRAEYDLPEVTLPEAKRPLVIDDGRREAILVEFLASNAPLLITLGDEPLQHFVSHYDQRARSLSKLVSSSTKYGQRMGTKIAGHECELLALVHPRQAAALGAYSKIWHERHKGWIVNQGKRLKRLMQ